MIAKIALTGIDFYQTRLSPKKGYRCAYSKVHGGTGCSGYVKHAIRDHGFWAAMPLSKKRFAACKAAAKSLNAENNKSKRPSKKSAWLDAVGYGLCGNSSKATEAGPASSTDCASGAPDCSPECTPSCDFCSCGG